MKSIFENTAPAYLHSSIYFLWLRWLGLWLMLLSVATGARLGQLAQERSPHPLKPGCRQWTKVRISLLSDHGALYTVHVTVLYTVQWQFIDCSISAELCRPCSSLTRWHCSAACLSLVPVTHTDLSLANMYFFRIWWNYVLMQKATKTGSNFRKMTHGK